MCGIVGYAGHRPAVDVVLEGLRRLEYRGYDSAGVAVLANGTLAAEKRAGKLGNLIAALSDQPAWPGTVGLGHTRWATHGPPNDPNAHPHLDCSGRLAVVHNGIIENFAALRRELAGRHHLASDTDTEVVAHLLEEEMAAQQDPVTGAVAAGALAAAMRRVCQRLDGAFTLVAVDARDPGAVVGARRNSPLVIGRGDGENFLASDVAAFIAYTR
ncbi:MAG: glutamine--fructose-6-phosphate aminotransferase, partial [Streptosporangiales bacterium]